VAQGPIPSFICVHAFIKTSSSPSWHQDILYNIFCSTSHPCCTLSTSGYSRFDSRGLTGSYKLGCPSCLKKLSTLLKKTWINLVGGSARIFGKWFRGPYHPSSASMPSSRHLPLHPDIRTSCTTSSVQPLIPVAPCLPVAIQVFIQEGWLALTTWVVHLASRSYPPSWEKTWINLVGGSARIFGKWFRGPYHPSSASVPSSRHLPLHPDIRTSCTTSSVQPLIPVAPCLPVAIQVFIQEGWLALTSWVLHLASRSYPPS